MFETISNPIKPYQTPYQINKHRTPNKEHRITNTQHPEPSTQNPAPRTQHPAYYIAEKKKTAKFDLTIDQNKQSL